MEISEEKLAELMDQTAEKTAAAIKAKQDATIDKRFVPGDAPEDKIVADKKGGFKSFGHFLRDLVDVERSKTPSEELKAWERAVEVKDLAEGAGSTGGYLVPEQFGGVIMDRTLEQAIVQPRADVITMQSNRITFAASVDANHQTNYFGGVIIYRPGEAGQKTATAPAYQQIALTLHKVAGLCHVSDELLEDSAIAVEQEIVSKFSQAISFVMDYDFINGDGVNAPLGFANSNNPCIVTVTAETGQGAGTIVWENIVKMWARAYNKDNVVWIANHDIFPQLAAMSMAVGTGGVPVWMPAGGISGLPYQTLMGKPLLFTEKCQTLGTAGDIILADLSQYKIGLKGGLQIATSIHFKFDYDQQSFRFVVRYDGQPKWSSALTPKVSSSTLSPFVVLNSTRT